MNHKKQTPIEVDEWDLPLTPADIQIRQSSGYLSSPPKEDILTKKINTDPPKHEFWQGRRSTPVITIGCLCALFGAVSYYVYSKAAPLITRSANFEALIEKYEKQAALKRQELRQIARLNRQSNGATSAHNTRLADGKKVKSLEAINTRHVKFQFLNVKEIYHPAPMVIQKDSKHKKLTDLFPAQPHILIKE